MTVCAKPEKSKIPTKGQILKIEKKTDQLSIY